MLIADIAVQIDPITLLLLVRMLADSQAFRPREPGLKKRRRRNEP